MDRWSGRVALVTGASTGIGACLIEELARNGMIVIGCARGAEKIEDQATKFKELPGKIHAYKIDLEKHKDTEKMFDWIEEKFGRLDLLVNNAATNAPQALIDGKVDDWMTMVNLNIVSYCYCTQLAVKLMMKKGIDDGSIIMINSYLGHYVCPTAYPFQFYSATKYAVTNLVESWRLEVRRLGTNIRIAGVCPSLTESNLGNVMFPDDPERAASIYDPEKNPVCMYTKDVMDSIMLIISAPAHVQVNDIVITHTNFVL